MAHHDPARPTVKEVLPLVNELYRGNGDVPCNRGSGIVGGHLHIVLDDGNTDTYFVESCLEYAIKDGCQACIDLARKLLPMSPTQRNRLYREKCR